MKRLAIGIITSLTLSGTLLAKEQKTYKFENTKCEQTDSCDLKGFEITITRLANEVYDENRISSHSTMEGFYETTDTCVVEKYAIVQFIKGGLFNSSAYDINHLETGYNTGRQFFGESIFPFIHPEWVVDSVDADPIYASYRDQNDRHGLYRIKKDESRSILFDDSSYYTYYFYRPKLPIARMHFSDMPTGGSYSEINITGGPNAGKTLYSSTNASMAFYTCIYKAEDVSENANEYDIDKEKAIGCLTWSNHHIFDPRTKSFKNSLTIDPRALSKE